MIKTIRFILILTTMALFLHSLHNTALAIWIDDSDTRVDLPVLLTPNNAVTPDMSVDQDGRVYVVYSDNRGGSPRIYINTYFPEEGWLPRATPINTGYPRSQSATVGNATSPKVCSDNSGHVYVAWVDDRAVKEGTGKRDIYFRYSKDYGMTWYPEFVDERIDTDNPAVGDSVNPQIACDMNGNVYFVWEDNRGSFGTYEVYFRSLHIEFITPVDYIVYHQYPDLRLNTGLESGRFSAHNPVISTDKGGHIYVAWEDSRNIPEEYIYNGIYFNASNNHGATWNVEGATRIDCAPVGFYSSLSPVISSDPSGYVYVAWLDNAGRPTRGEEFSGDGTFDVYFNRAWNYGTTWGATWNKDKFDCDGEDQRIDTPGKKIEAKDVAIANNNKGVVAIVWADNALTTQTGVSTNYNIFYNHSENFGRTFLDSSSNILIDRGVSPGTTNPYNPKVQVDNRGTVFATWVDKRTNNYDIYFNFSGDKGKKWVGGDFRLDNSIPPGDSFNQVMAIDNKGHFYIAWQDTRTSQAPMNYNIYFISGYLDIETLIIEGQRTGAACFIATAAYGSPFERHVKILREFRDSYLLTNSAGRLFISAYYHSSPPVARFITRHSYLKPVVRTVLLPVVGIAMLALYTTILQKIILISTIVLMISLLIFRQDA